MQYTGKTCKCLKYTVNYKKTLKLAIKRGYKIYSKNKLAFVTILTVGASSKKFLDFFIKNIVIIVNIVYNATHIEDNNLHKFIIPC